MEEVSEKKKGIEDLLEKIPAEKCWAITAKALTRLVAMRTAKTDARILGKGEGIVDLISGFKKHEEIFVRLYGAEGGMRLFTWVKETYKIPVEDAVGAVRLRIVATTLFQGPEFRAEIVEESRERAVVRINKCAWWERIKDLGRDPEFVICPEADQARGETGLKAVNPKLTYKVTKAMPWGDPYCEWVIEFKEE